jgi:putative oxidoreductase
MAKRILSYQSLNTDLACLLLRLSFGGLFMRFGYLKLISFNDILAIFPDPIHIGSNLSLILVIFAEFFCGFLVAIGLLTRLAVIPIFFTMSVVFFIVHSKQPFDEKALPFVFWLLSMVIFLLGGGKFSLDRVFFNQKRRR